MDKININIDNQGTKNKNLCISRLYKDLNKIDQDGGDCIFATPIEDNIMEWDAVIFGPEETAWEGGVFKLNIKFTEDYPSKPPNIKFLTKIFHPNVYIDGRICLDVLDKNWSPIYDILNILISIRSLLSDPNPDSPANVEAAKLFKDDITSYFGFVKDCVENSQTLVE